MSLNRNSSPSDHAAAGMHDTTRAFVMTWTLEETLTAKVLPRQYVPGPCRILAVRGFRRTSGGANTTDVAVRLNGDTVQAEVMAFAGTVDNSAKDAALLTSHAGYDSTNMGINVAPGDYLDVSISAVETVAPSGLSVQVILQHI